MHICRGSYNRPNHDCWCSRGRDHSEAEHKADMDAEQAREAAAELASASALSEAAEVLRYIGRKDLAAAVEAVRA